MQDDKIPPIAYLGAAAFAAAFYLGFVLLASLVP
jgi:hypothetical protein